MAHQIQDDGFHEIQLNGKQLVFLFMAATVVSVVIFLCGVLVGRGVRAERGSIADNTVSVSAPDTTPQPAPAPPAAPPAGSDPTAAAAPPPTVDDLSYFNRLEKSKPSAEQLKPAAGERAAAPTPAAKSTAPPVQNKSTANSLQNTSTATPVRKETKDAAVERPAPQQAPVPEPARAAATADRAASTEPAGAGFAVQIAALNVRSEAESIAKRLSSKGYTAYVMSPPNGTPSVYRVRIGKFNTRREAETVAAKLQKEEQFTPWVTR